MLDENLSAWPWTHICIPRRRTEGGTACQILFFLFTWMAYNGVHEHGFATETASTSEKVCQETMVGKKLWQVSFSWSFGTRHKFENQFIKHTGINPAAYAYTRPNWFSFGLRSFRTFFLAVLASRFLKSCCTFRKSNEFNFLRESKILAGSQGQKWMRFDDSFV